MSIFKETFPDFIKKQLEKRQEVIASGTGRYNEAVRQYEHSAFAFNESRSDEFIAYNSKTCTMRLSSGVNVLDTAILEDENLSGAALAKKYVLEAGIKDGGANRGGMGRAYGDSDINSDDRDGYGIVPMPGIVDATISTKSAYGSLRTAKVNFVCHNMRQLKVLELLYMRPGYTLLLEWGWTPYIDNDGNVENTFPYVGDMFFKQGTDNNKIEQTIFKNREDSGGNYDAIIGYCKNFEYNLRADGGFNCKTEIIAKGEVIESLKDIETRTPLKHKDIQYTYAPFTKVILDKINAWSIAVADVNNVTLQNPFTAYAWTNSFESSKTEKRRAEFYSNLLAEDLEFEIDNKAYQGEESQNALLGYCIPKDEEYKGIDFGGSPFAIRAETTYIRWDCFAYLLNKYAIPQDEHGNGIFQIQTNQLLEDPDTKKRTKIVPLKYANLRPSYLERKVDSLTLQYWIGPDNPTVDYKREIAWNQCDLSANPQICVLPHTYTANKAEIGGKPAYYEVIKRDGLYEPMAKLLIETSPYKDDIDIKRDLEEDEIHRSIAHIYIGAEYLEHTFDQMYFTDTGNINEDYSLFKFLKRVWDDISGCTNGAHKFDLHIDNTPSGKVLRVVDFLADSKEIDLTKVHELKVQSLDSTVRNVQYNTTLPNAVSSTIAIAAQAPDNIDSLNEASFAAINKGVRDRFANLSKTDVPSKEQIEKWESFFKKNVRMLNDITFMRATNNKIYGLENTEYTIDASYMQNEDKEVQMIYPGILVEFLLDTNEKANQYQDEEAFLDFTRVRGSLNGVQQCIDYFHSVYATTKIDEEDSSKTYYKGQPVKVHTPRLSSVIPLKFNCELDGIGGLIIGNVFKLPKNRLPLSYREDDIYFIVMKEEQKISSKGDWTTSIKGNLILLADENTISTRDPHYSDSWDDLKGKLSVTTTAAEYATNELADGSNLWLQFLKRRDTPWSACFISWVATRTPVSFPKSASHWSYTKKVFRGEGGDKWQCLDPFTTPLQLGDIIVYNRSNSYESAGGDILSGNVYGTLKTYDVSFAQIKLFVQDNPKFMKGMFSHADIVLSLSGEKTQQLGGNVNRDVSYNTSGNAGLEKIGGKTYIHRNWIAFTNKYDSESKIYSGKILDENGRLKSDQTIDKKAYIAVPGGKRQFYTKFLLGMVPNTDTDSRYFAIIRHKDSEVVNSIIENAKAEKAHWGNKKEDAPEVAERLYAYYENCNFSGIETVYDSMLAHAKGPEASSEDSDEAAEAIAAAEAAYANQGNTEDKYYNLLGNEVDESEASLKITPDGKIYYRNLQGQTDEEKQWRIRRR